MKVKHFRFKFGILDVRYRLKVFAGLGQLDGAETVVEREDLGDLHLQER